MPPKKKEVSWVDNSSIKKVPCSKKSTTKLATGRTASVLLLKEALKNTYVSEAENSPSYYDYFKNLDWANECVFSYPDSDWVGIYLKDPDGNIYWSKKADGTVDFEKLYFQIQLDSDGDPEIVNFKKTIPKELESKQSCAVVEGKCVETSIMGNIVDNVSKGVSNISKIAKTAVSKARKVIPSEFPEIMTQPNNQVNNNQNIQKKEKVSILDDSSKQKLTREEFEKMGSKEAIINWMIENMDPVDILSCLQKDEPIELEENIASTSGSNNNITKNSNIQELAGNMDKLEIQDIIQEVSFNDLIDQINEIQDLEARSSRIIEICTTSGIHDEDDFGIRKSKKNGIQLTIDDEVQNTQDINDLIDKCAKAEAKRLSNELKKGKKQI